ncbi:MAG: trehalose-phosphatase [Bdellovibrionota bacterium]
MAKLQGVEKLFSPEILSRIETAARGELALAFDYDGTLAPIVPDILGAPMRPETVRLLKRVSGLYPTAVVSGRGFPDLAQLMKAQLGSATKKLILIGSHGMQFGSANSGHCERHEKLVMNWMEAISSELSEQPGLEIENKRISVSIHFRQAPNRAQARRRILDTLSRLRSVRVVGGKLVFNLLPADAANKGTALRALKRKLGAKAVLFVGDDVTDEDAFALRAPWVQSVRIGKNLRSQARYFIGSQAEMDGLLEFLLAAKSGRA